MVFVGDSQLIGKVDWELALELHLISILHVIRLLIRLSVQVYHQQEYSIL